MTEQEWQAYTDPLAMLEVVTDSVSPRKERLFACECCRLISDLMPDPRCNAAVQLAEQFADRLATEDALSETLDVVDAIAGKLQETARASYGVEVYPAGWPPTTLAAVLPCVTCDNDGANIAHDACYFLLEMTEAAMRTTRQAWAKARILCIFGPLPFRPVTIDPAWLTWHDGLIPQMAQNMYDERNFNDMPILSDALIDAGCTNQDMIDHCRSKEPHCRGCWVVDLLLGRS